MGSLLYSPLPTKEKHKKGFEMETQMNFVVVCPIHGKLAEVLTAALGLAVFVRHVQLMAEENHENCGSCIIYPKEQDPLVHFVYLN